MAILSINIRTVDTGEHTCYNYTVAAHAPLTLHLVVCPRVFSSACPTYLDNLIFRVGN